MRLQWPLRVAAMCVFALAAATVSSASALEVDCATCHRALTETKVVHPAVQIGCMACHADLDAAVVPHQLKTKLAKGLAAPPPDLCFRCHDKKSFEGRYMHAPAAAGLCLTCHDPHGGEEPKLVRKPGAALCLDCHPDVRKEPHVLVGFSRKGHPIGEELKASAARDPLRPGRLFYCGSCHEPHGADHKRLNRFDSGSIATFCRRCHKV